MREAMAFFDGVGGVPAVPELDRAARRMAKAVREAREVAKSERPPLRLAWPQGQAERTCVREFEPGDARIFTLKFNKN
jgi:hypothetical protein